MPEKKAVESDSGPSDAYEAPRVESHLEREEVQREVAYAGTISNPTILSRD